MPAPTAPDPRPFGSYSDGDLQVVSRYVRQRAMQAGRVQLGYADTEADVAPDLKAEIQYRQAVEAYEATEAATARAIQETANAAAETSRAETIIAAVRAA